MSLKAIGGRDQIAMAADWVEVSAMAASRSRCAGSELARSLHTLSESFEDAEDESLVELEDTEEEILNRRDEEWLGDVFEELRFRAGSLGSNYPFELVPSTGDWLIVHREEELDTRFIYESCLMISAVRDGVIDPGLPRMDYVLQLVAYLVSGALIDGESHWIGHPRPDGTNFKAAFERCLGRMGFVRPQLSPPPWSFQNEKDAGIDIISWRGFADGMPGRLVVFGQVASGRREWKNKSVNSFLRSDIRPWLGALHPETHLEAMYIPWQQYSEVNHRDRNRATRSVKPFREWAHVEALHLEKKLGIVVDRDRLVELASKRIRTGLGDESRFLSELREWHAKAIEEIRRQ